MRALNSKGSDAHMLLQIHDELLLEVPAGHPRQRRRARAEMFLQNVVSWNVPLGGHHPQWVNWQDVTK